jgi:hypothetical protein
MHTAKAATVAEAAAAVAATPLSRHPLALLHDPATIRARCAAILRAVESNVSEHFTIDRSRLPAVAERVAALTLKRFPDLRIPYHSRWRHFEAAGIDRKAQLDTLLASHSAAGAATLESTAHAARARIDLTLVSVLLDAGAGSDWRYLEKTVGSEGSTPLARSEGLGVASFHAFVNGSFSASPTDPLRVDAEALPCAASFNSPPATPWWAWKAALHCWRAWAPPCWRRLQKTVCRHARRCCGTV